MDSNKFFCVVLKKIRIFAKNTEVLLLNDCVI